MRGLIELSAEIGPPQVIRAFDGAAADRKRLEAKGLQAADDGGRIERGMNRITGARVIERECKQRFGRQAGTGAPEPDPRGGELPQIPQISQG